jgi:hypothetical protein
MLLHRGKRTSSPRRNAAKEYELGLVQDDPEQWVNTANQTLLAELRRWAPSIDWTGMQDVEPLLDALEAALTGDLPKSHKTSAR